MSTRRFRRRIGWAMIILLVIAVGAYFLITQPGAGISQPFIPATVAQPVGDLPNPPDKPQPKEITFEGCPPEGRGGDSDLNLLKNRVDVGNYSPVSFDSLTLLTWPKTVEQRYMKDWPADGRAFIAQYAGVPIIVEGYIESVREAPPEPANCNFTGSSLTDWVIYFTKNARDVRSQAVVIRATPRVRANHKWTLDLLRSTAVDNHLPVRVSGWLLFDPEHPGDVGKTRATLWEIHPVMQIEIFQNGKWVTLDKLAN